MSNVIDEAVAALRKKISGQFDGVAKFVVTGEGTIMIDANGVRASDDEADVTLTSSAEVFKAILDGDTSPATAFMSGKLLIEGSMGMALKLGSVLA
jgi:putative sterol carrier protein